MGRTWRPLLVCGVLYTLGAIIALGPIAFFLIIIGLVDLITALAESYYFPKGT